MLSGSFDELPAECRGRRRTDHDNPVRPSIGDAVAAEEVMK
jgi:hypothetical protein